MDISVCSICRDEEDLIRPWIETLLSIPDIKEINILDTGSIDNTINYITSYEDKRINLYTTAFSYDFAECRNYIISKAGKNIEWLSFFDIDEIFCEGYLDLFDLIRSSDTSDIDIIRFFHIKFYDFNRLWFHNPPTVPSYNSFELGPMIYGLQKDTIALFKRNVVAGFDGKLHERLILTKENPNTKFCSLKNVPKLQHLNELQDDVFVGHYSKAKLHAMSRRIGKSFDWCVGKKRSIYRTIEPKILFGKKYDKNFISTATDTDYEQLGKNQMKQFIDVEGHNFPSPGFNVYNLNNEYIKKYFPEDPSWNT